MQMVYGLSDSPPLQNACLDLLGSMKSLQFASWLKMQRGPEMRFEGPLRMILVHLAAEMEFRILSLRV